MFIEEHPECHGVVKYNFFLKCFRENFNLSFSRSQIDVCFKYEELGIKIKDPHDTAKKWYLQKKSNMHKRRASKFFKR